jgi:hypothetical protein
MYDKDNSVASFIDLPLAPGKNTPATISFNTVHTLVTKPRDDVPVSADVYQVDWASLTHLVTLASQVISTQMSDVASEEHPHHRISSYKTLY